MYRDLTQRASPSKALSGHLRTGLRYGWPSREGPRGQCPGAQACGEVGRGAGLQGGGRGNQDPVRQAFQSRALTQGLREPGQALGVPSTMFPGVIWMPGVGRSTGKGTDWRLLQTSVR